ncbi:hypothetical protein D3C73_1501480 [compost metagenome]
MYFLIVLVNRIDHAALRFTGQGNRVTVFVGAELGFASAKGHFLIAFFVTQRLERYVRAGIAAIAHAGIDDER